MAKGPLSLKKAQVLPISVISQRRKGAWENCLYILFLCQWEEMKRKEKTTTTTTCRIIGNRTSQNIHFLVSSDTNNTILHRWVFSKLGSKTVEKILNGVLVSKFQLFKDIKVMLEYLPPTDTSLMKALKDLKLSNQNYSPSESTHLKIETDWLSLKLIRRYEGPKQRWKRTKSENYIT